MLVQTVTAPLKESTKNAYYAHIDTLRVFFVSIVLFHHWYSDNPFKFLPFGSTIAFVLSSFLLTNVLLKEKFASEGGYWRKTGNFLGRRFLRTLPIYLILIGVHAVFNPRLRETIGYFLTFTQNYLVAHNPNPITNPVPLAHTWSLAVQEQFYVVLPITVFFISRRLFVPFWIAMTCLGLAIRFWYFFEGFPFEWNHFTTECCLDCFGIGALISYYNFFHPEDLKKLLKNKILLFTLIGLYASSLFGYFNESNGIVAEEGPLKLYNNLYRTTERTFVSLLSVWFIAWGIYFPSQTLLRISRNAVIHFLSKISYGIYIYHMSVSGGVNRLLVNTSFDEHGFVSITLKFILTTLVAAASFYWIESPILKWRKALR